MEKDPLLDELEERIAEGPIVSHRVTSGKNLWRKKKMKLEEKIYL